MVRKTDRQLPEGLEWAELSTKKQEVALGSDWNALYLVYDDYTNVYTC